MSPQDTLASLISQPLIRPNASIPKLPGIYLLYDHTETPRYIGETGNLWNRVYCNHCAGDGNSHKWACHYNHGRLWHSSKSTHTDMADGKIAKKLRAALARRYCLVRVLPLPSLSDRFLRRELERAVRDIAPNPMNDWNDQKSIPTCAPDELIDQLVIDLGWGHAQQGALERQAARWAKAAGQSI